jgi:hypothetical protein
VAIITITEARTHARRVEIATNAAMIQMAIPTYVLDMDGSPQP